MQEILAIIPARGGSKGIPMKNLVKLDKKPLLSYTINASLNSKNITRTIVSTDNKKIESTAKKLGAEVVVRPRRLSGDLSKIEDGMTYTLDFLKKHENYEPDVIVLLQNTSPLRNSKHIDDAFKIFNTQKLDSVFSGFVSHYFFWENKNNKLKPVNYDPLNRPNRQEIKNQFGENGALYITKYQSYKKSKCRISGKIGVFVMSEESSLQIDSMPELFLIENIMKRK